MSTDTRQERLMVEVPGKNADHYNRLPANDDIIAYVEALPAAERRDLIVALLLRHPALDSVNLATVLRLIPA